MTSQLSEKQLGIHDAVWQIVRTDDPRQIDGLLVPGLMAVISECDLGEERWSRGQFFC